MASRGGLCSSRVLAAVFLKSGAVDEQVATRLLAPVLEPEGFLYVEGAGWKVSGSPRTAAIPATTGPRRVACAVRLREGSSRRGREAVESLCVRPAGGAAVETREWDRIAIILDDADAVFLKPEEEAPALLAELLSRGLPRPARVLSLATAVRGSARFPRSAGPEEIAAILGCGWLVEDTPAAAAGNIAACLERAAELGARKSKPVRGAPATGPLSMDALSGAPSAPGVYRFFDEKGDLLYVGKSSNLRRRLGSYAALAGAPRPAGRRVLRELHRVRRVEWEATGSDLEAIFREARLIVSRRPRANVQVVVHERGRSYAASRTSAYLLPASTPGSVNVIFSREGVFEGSCRLGPRGGGKARARGILKRLWARGGSRAGRPGAETELLASWLSRYGDRVARVELDACRGPAHALEVLMRAAKEPPPSGAEPTYHR